MTEKNFCYGEFFFLGCGGDIGKISLFFCFFFVRKSVESLERKQGKEDVFSRSSYCCYCFSGNGEKLAYDFFVVVSQIISTVYGTKNLEKSPQNIQLAQKILMY